VGRRIRSPRTAEFWTVVLLSVGLLVIAWAEVSSADPGGHAARSSGLVDGARRDAGVAPLSRDPRLDRVAASHASRMAEADAIFHNSHLEQDVNAEGVEWDRLGENVGMGPDVETIHEGFMASAPHRANVLEPQFNAIGVGVAVGSDDQGRQRLYVVHVFADTHKDVNKTSRVVTPVLRTPAPKKAAPQPVVVAVPPKPAPSTARPVVRVVDHSPDPNAVTGGVVVPLGL
jgi:hypothetical protein